MNFITVFFIEKDYLNSRYYFYTFVRHFSLQGKDTAIHFRAQQQKKQIFNE